MSERGGPWRLVGSLLFLLLVPGTVAGLVRNPMYVAIPAIAIGQGYCRNVRRWWPRVKPWAA